MRIDAETLEAIEVALTDAWSDVWPRFVVAIGAAPADDPAATSVEAIEAALVRADEQTHAHEVKLERRIASLLDALHDLRLDIDEALALGER